jgi:hypothetical protein
MIKEATFGISIAQNRDIFTNLVPKRANLPAGFLKYQIFEGFAAN